MFAEFRFRQAEAERVVGRADEAVAQYRAATGLNPNHFEAFNNLGNVLQERCQLAESLEAHRRAAALRPNMPEVQFNLGNTLLNAGQYEEATSVFESAIQLRPDYAQAINNLGNALRARGLTAEARQAYQKAAALMPDFGDAAVNIGVALSQEGNLEGAIEQFRRAIALKPGLPEAHLNLGNALKDAGQIDEAIAAYRHAVTLQPISLNWSNLLFALHFHPAIGPRDSPTSMRRGTALACSRFSKPRRSRGAIGTPSVRCASATCLRIFASIRSAGSCSRCSAITIEVNSRSIATPMCAARQT